MNTTKPTPTNQPGNKKTTNPIIIILVLIIIAVGAYFFFTNGSTNSYTNQTANSNTKSADQVSCEAAGGNWGWHGPSSTKNCNLPTTDGGHECANETDCQAGLCIAELDLNQQEIVDQGGIVQTAGTCPAWQRIFGCYYIVADGKVEGGELCID